METTEELSTFLTAATVDGILGRLLYRGAAWSLMRKNGVLPQNAPPLGATIETDLAEHGFALILQIFHRVCDSGLAAVQLLIGVDHDGRYTGVRRVCQYVRALQTGAVFALGAAVLQAAAERVGVAEAVIENGSGSTCA